MHLVTVETISDQLSWVWPIIKDIKVSTDLYGLDEEKIVYSLSISLYSMRLIQIGVVYEYFGRKILPLIPHKI